MLKNKHKGQTCIIIGNGPSLRDVPAEFLNQYPTIGSNRVYLRYIPTYYAAINPLVISQYWDEIDAIPAVKFIRASLAKGGFFGIPLQSLREQVFSYEPLKMGVYEGFTVTFVSMQLAFWMGFETVLLVGVDHRYTYSGNASSEQIQDGDDPNHFDPNYFKGAKWHAPDLIRSEAAYVMARDAFRTHGRRIINLTDNTALDVFKKDNIKYWSFYKNG